MTHFQIYSIDNLVAKTPCNRIALFNKNTQSYSSRSKFCHRFIKIKKDVINFCNRAANFLGSSRLENCSKRINDEYGLAENVGKRLGQFSCVHIDINKDRTKYTIKELKDLLCLVCCKNQTLLNKETINEYLHNSSLQATNNLVIRNEAGEFFYEPANISAIVNDKVLQQSFKDSILQSIKSDETKNKFDIQDFISLKNTSLFPLILELFIEEEQIQQVCNYLLKIDCSGDIRFWQNYTTVKNIFDKIKIKAKDQHQLIIEHIQTSLPTLINRDTSIGRSYTTSTVLSNLVYNGIINTEYLSRFDERTTSTFLYHLISDLDNDKITFENFEYVFNLIRNNYTDHNYKDQALRFAISVNNRKAIDLLTQDGCNLSMENKENILITAMKNSNFDFFLKALESVDKPDLIAGNKHSVLCYAIEHNLGRYIGVLIDKYTTLDVEQLNLYNELIAVCSNKNIWGNVYSHLIEPLIRLAKINSTDDWGNTALIHATKNNNITMVQVLIDNNAETNLTNKDNKTALNYAQRYQYSEIEQLLLAADSVEYSFLSDDTDD